MPGKSHEKTLRFNPWTDIPTIPNAMSIAGAVLAAKTIVEAGDETVRPEISGKLALALETSSLLAHLVGSRLETTGQSQLARVARGIGNLAFAVSLPFAFKSTLSYIERARQSKHRNDK